MYCCSWSTQSFTKHSCTSLKKKIYFERRHYQKTNRCFFCCLNEAKCSMQGKMCCIEANNPSHMDECMHARTLFPWYQNTSCLKKQLSWFALTAAGTERGTLQKDRRGFPIAAAKHRSNSSISIQYQSIHLSVLSNI